MEMSIAVMTISTALAKVSLSKPSSVRKDIRFRLARLQLELSRCMYSLHGLDAVMRPDSGVVCQSLMVSSYCSPGSAHAQAASAIVVNNFGAQTVSTTWLSSRLRRPNSVWSSTARMNPSLTRTELFAFWYCTLVLSVPPRSMSNPASRSTRIRSEEHTSELQSRGHLV